MCTHHFAYTYLLYIVVAPLALRETSQKFKYSKKSKDNSHPTIIQSPLIYTDMLKLIVGFNILSMSHKLDGCQAIKT